MAVRAKFVCTSITRSKSGNDEIQTINMMPVTSGSEENKQFWKWTPSGKLELGTINPEAAKEFELNGEYYLDISKCEKTN